MAQEFNIGDLVIPNPRTWQLNEEQAWGRGVGIGVIVEPPFPLQEGSVDVAWSSGRSFEKVSELLRADVGE